MSLYIFFVSPPPSLLNQNTSGCSPFLSYLICDFRHLISQKLYAFGIQKYAIQLSFSYFTVHWSWGHRTKYVLQKISLLLQGKL